jgi:hypothetical protein
MRGVCAEQSFDLEGISVDFETKGRHKWQSQLNTEDLERNNFISAALQAPCAMTGCQPAFIDQTCCGSSFSKLFV